MDYIVLDIEFNGRKFASDRPMEVIEIGAVRLTGPDLTLAPPAAREFSALIKPVYFPKLNDFIRKKTGIPQADIDRAPRFPAVIAAFREWLGEAPFTLVTWGGEDVKRIVFDTRMHKLDDAYWLAVDYYDLLKGYIRSKNAKNDVSVEAALAELGIESDGTAHRALDDARMTAEIFRRAAAAGQLDLSETQRFKDTFTNAKERRFVKNAIRALRAQKREATWEAVAEHFLKDKVPLDDPRKLGELQQYFETEADKPPTKGDNGPT